MNLDFTPEETAFRDEVRAFIRDNYPKELANMGTREDLTREQFLAWHKILGKKGWSTIAWPTKYGGTGWTSTQRYIWSEENARMDTIMPLPFSVAMVGPVIYTFGNEEQKAKHLPGIRSGDVWWCQGYSEPGAGSDLASVKTTAVRDGDHYVINGQKTWTTLAQHADWGFFLCRTDPTAKAQEGISFIVFPMTLPGILLLDSPDWMAVKTALRGNTLVRYSKVAGVKEFQRRYTGIAGFVLVRHHYYLAEVDEEPKDPARTTTSSHIVAVRDNGKEVRIGAHGQQDLAQIAAATHLPTAVEQDCRVEECFRLGHPQLRADGPMVQRQ